MKEIKEIFGLEDYQNRIEKAKELMKHEGMDFLFVPISVNLNYLTGIDIDKTERLTAALIPLKGEPVIICPAFELGRINDLTPFENISVWEEDENPFELTGDIIQNDYEGDPSIGIESKTWFSEYSSLFEQLENADFRNASNILENLRLIKSKKEINSIKKAIQIIGEARDELLENIEKGMTQTQLTEMLRDYATKKRPGEELSGIINFGKNTSEPHGASKDIKIEEGTVIMIDTGVKVNGYVSDITRTTVYGDPPEDFENIFNTLLSAQNEAFETIKPGVQAQEVDRAARRVIDRAGYGKYFTHRLGHGIGLEVHERPWIAEGNKQRLKEGMTFTVEPGIYLPERFGVRIEENIVVTENGCECLSDQPDNFQALRA